MNTSDAKPARSANLSSGRLCLLLAALMWSTNGLFAKSTIFDIWPTEVRGQLLAFWRALFAGLVLLPAVRHPRWNIALVPMTLGFTAMNVCFLQSMTLTTAANAIWLQSTAPLWVFLYGLLWAREKIERLDLVSLVCGLAGASLILFFELGRTGADTARAGVLFGMASGVFYASVLIFLRSLRHEQGVWLISLNHLVAAAMLAPYILYLGIWPSPRQLGVLVAFGPVQMGLPYLLFARGLRDVRSQEAAAIVLLEPVLSPLWVYLAHNEQPKWWTLVGAGFILAGLVARYHFSSGSKETA